MKTAYSNNLGNSNT